MERRLLSYNIKEVEPYINWLYFYYANGVGAASGAVRGGKISDFAVRGGTASSAVLIFHLRACSHLIH